MKKLLIITGITMISFANLQQNLQGAVGNGTVIWDTGTTNTSTSDSSKEVKVKYVDTSKLTPEQVRMFLDMLSKYQGGSNNPDEDNGGFSGGDPVETVRLLIKLLADGGGDAEIISFWESILGELLTEEATGLVVVWNPPSDGTTDPDRDSGNPGDGDDEGGYIDIEKLKEEGGIAQTIPIGTEEGPAWGINGDTASDWINWQSGSNNSDTNADDDRSTGGAGNTDDGSVKGPAEIVDPPPIAP